MRPLHVLALAAACSGGGSSSPGSQGPSPVGPSGTVVVSNMADNTVTLIDAASARPVATLPTGKGPHEVAISHDGRWALVSNYGVGREAGNTITVVDIPGARVDRTIDLADFRRPHGMAFLPGDTAFVVTSEVARALVVVDFRSGTVIRSIPSNGRGSHMLGGNAAGDRIATGNIADGTISFMSPYRSDSGVTIPVRRQPEGIAMTPDGRFVWAGSNQDSVVVIVDLAQRKVVETLTGFVLPYRIAISSDGRRAIISDPAAATVRVVDVSAPQRSSVITFAPDSLVATAEVKGSASPEGVALSRDGRWAFVTLQGRNRLAIIDIDAHRVIALAPTGVWSDGVGWSPLGVRR